MTTTAWLLDLGHREYGEVWNLQRRFHEARVAGTISDGLVLVEHPHVLTVGRRGSRANILTDRLPIFAIERGGDVTYHGPGQVVGYPIVGLEAHGLDIGTYLRSVEEVLLRAVAEFGIKGARKEGHPGVWIGERKLASIGIAVRHWVTFHGFALNVNVDLSYFHLIRPCGLDSHVITSMQEVLCHAPDLARVKEAVCRHFAEVFDVELVPMPPRLLVTPAPLPSTSA